MINMRDKVIAHSKDSVMNDFFIISLLQRGK